MKILIVDNSARMRKLIIEMLKQKQNESDALEFYECEDGFYSLAEFERVNPDRVLIDVATKKMNGLDAAALIKKKFPDSRIIIVTDYDDIQFREKAMYLGIDHYVLKENLNQINDIINIS